MESRRDFLRAVGVLGAGAMSTDVLSVLAQTPARAGEAGRVDVHHHVFPPKYVAELASRNLAGGEATSWSVGRTLDDMDKAGVATSILSVTTPAVSFAEPDLARRVAREGNEWVAGLRETIRDASAASRCCRCRTSTPVYEKSNTRSTRSRRTASGC